MGGLRESLAEVGRVENGISDEEEAAPQATGIKMRATITQAFSKLN